jgi:hypothetical protein
MSGLPVQYIYFGCSIGACILNNIYFVNKRQYATVTTETLSHSYNKTHSIIRNDSEFSLGLNRSESFANIAREYGEFCSTGQILIEAAKLTGVVLTISLIARKLM